MDSTKRSETCTFCTRSPQGLWGQRSLPYKILAVWPSDLSTFKRFQRWFLSQVAQLFLQPGCYGLIILVQAAAVAQQVVLLAYDFDLSTALANNTRYQQTLGFTLLALPHDNEKVPCFCLSCLLRTSFRFYLSPFHPTNGSLMVSSNSCRRITRVKDSPVKDL